MIAQIDLIWDLPIAINYHNPVIYDRLYLRPVTLTHVYVFNWDKLYSVLA